MKLEDFIINYVKSDNQNNTFTNVHTRYDVTIDYKGRKITVEYQCNPLCSDVNLYSVLDCLVTDAYAYWNSDDGFDFMEEFGYEDPKRAKEIYNGCKDEFAKLCYLLNGTGGLEKLNEIMQESY